MKKLLIGIGLFVLMTAAVFAQAGQTYYYQYVETVDKSTGVRSRDSRGNMYITFTRNSCYQSDEKGIRQVIFGAQVPILTYQGERNNLYIYSYTIGMMQFQASDNYTFSKDYKKLNTNSTHFALPDEKNKVHVYERATPPTNAPDVFY